MFRYAILSDLVLAFFRRFSAPQVLQRGNFSDNKLYFLFYARKMNFFELLSFFQKNLVLMFPFLYLNRVDLISEIVFYASNVSNLQTK